MSIEDFYTKYYNLDGLLVRINENESGLPLDFDPNTKTFNEAHFLTINLRNKEAELGEQLDLSDRDPNPKKPKKKIRLNSLQSSDRLIIEDRFPEDINYNTGLAIGLTTETIDYFGLRVAQIYYQTLSAETLEPLATPIKQVFERYKYNWDAATKTPLARVKEIQFYQEDGVLTEQKKILPKTFYNVSDRADITKRRRSTIVDWLVARANELGLATETKDYFSLYKLETDNYTLYGDPDILTIVENSTETFLNVDTQTEMGTMRQAILLCLTKALEATPDAEIEQFLTTNYL